MPFLDRSVFTLKRPVIKVVAKKVRFVASPFYFWSIAQKFLCTSQFEKQFAQNGANIAMS